MFCKRLDWKYLRDKLWPEHRFLSILIIVGVFVFVVFPFLMLSGILVLAFESIVPYFIFGATTVSLLGLITGMVSRKYKLRAWCMARNFAVILCVFYYIMFFFLAGCSFAMWSGMQFQSSKLQFPLGAEGCALIALDKQGRIYYAVESYHRLQVYDKHGRFLRGWFAPIESDQHRDLYVDEDDYVHVVRNDQDYTYSPKGELISVDRFSGKRPDNQANALVTDSEGNTFRVESPFLRPRLVRTTATGVESVLVSDSLGLWIIKCPLPMALFFFPTLVFAALLLGRVSDLRKRS